MRRLELLGAALLTVAIAFHILDKIERGVLAEMFWSCNVTAVMIAAGVSLDRRELTSVGWLTFASIGFWLWGLDMLAGAASTPPSIVIHLLSPVVGLLHVRRVGLWPRTVAAAFGLQIALFGVALTLTDPALNINMAHAVWSPVGRWFPNIWLYHAVNLAGFGAVLVVASAGCRRLGLVREVRQAG